jgi:nucleotide-binding universal stress UspA family protein
MQTLRQLVAGTDFSEGAEQALEVAVGIAVAAVARITLVHVCELDVDGCDDQRLLQCEQVLARAVAKHRRQGLELTSILRIGRPWEKLHNVAVEVGASLIVVGRHGAGRGRSVEIGFVADRLVRCASRPVLTVAYEFDRLDVEAHEANNPCRKRVRP